jgi:protein-disulfide isomerase
VSNGLTRGGFLCLRIAAAVAAVLVLAGAPVRAEMSADEKTEIGTIIRDYLLANPEVLEEAFGVLQQRRKDEAASAQTETIAAASDLIFRSEHQAVVGNPLGAITLVEFFDYNCGYCKRAVSDMNALIEANPDLRIVLKEFPILSEGSMQAARISAAVKDAAPERFLEFHEALFSRPGPADYAKALAVAGDLGLDAEALKAAAGSDAITANLQEVQELAGRLGISGTPSYVIGMELIPGAVGYDGLQQKVAAARTAAAADADDLQPDSTN